MSFYAKRPLLQYAAAGFLLLSSIPAASADCFINDRGEEICNGISVAARIAIGFAIFLAILFLLLALGAVRRRRMHRDNQRYIVATEPAQPYPPGYDNHQQYAYGQSPPQYPPPTHPGQYGQYNGAPGYPNMPPYMYAAPTGDPPAHKE